MTTDKYLYWNPNDPDHHNSVVTIKAAAYNVEMVEVSLADYPFAFYTFRSQLIPIDRLGKDYWEGYAAAIDDVEKWAGKGVKALRSENIKKYSAADIERTLAQLDVLQPLIEWVVQVRKKFKL
jgi:hypothetical protein